MVASSRLDRYLEVFAKATAYIPTAGSIQEVAPIVHRARADSSENLPLVDSKRGIKSASGPRPPAWPESGLSARRLRDLRTSSASHSPPACPGNPKAGRSRRTARRFAPDFQRQRRWNKGPDGCRRELLCPRDHSYGFYASSQECTDPIDCRKRKTCRDVTRGPNPLESLLPDCWRKDAIRRASGDRPALQESRLPAVLPESLIGGALRICPDQENCRLSAGWRTTRNGASLEEGPTLTACLLPGDSGRCTGPGDSRVGPTS